jgi:diguanylate cyclase (GGDEF)-like protein
MKTYYNLHLAKVVDLLKSETTFNKQNNLFIKHYNTFDVPVDEVRLAVGEDTNIKVFSYRFSSSRMQDAYEPILGWIRELYLNNVDDDIDTFLDKAKVYKLHRPIFKSFIKLGRGKRNEEVFIPEIEYDKHRFIVSLINVLEYLSTNMPLILILNRLHFASLSMIEFLEAFITNEDMSKISLFVTYNESYQIEKYILPKWNKLFDIVKTKSKIIDLGTKEKFETAIERTNYIPITSRYQRYIEKLENMLETLAYEQAFFYLDLIFHKIDMEKSNIALNIRRTLLEIFIKASIYINDMNRASILCEKLRTLEDKNIYNNSNYTYYRLATLTKLFSSQYDDAQKSANILINIAQSLENEFMIFEAKLTKFLVDNEGFKEITVRTSYIEVSNDLINDAQKYNYRNMLAYILVMSFENIDTHKLAHEEKVNQANMFDWGIEIAKDLENYNCMLSAYKKNILMASFFGHYDKVDLYNNKCLDIIHIMDNPLEEASMCNTLGYNTLIIEDFSRANEYFNKAISILTKDNKIDVICETLYNKGMNAIGARDYISAKDNLETCITIMRNMNLQRLNTCNISKVYGLTSFCYYKLGQQYNLSLLLSKMQRILSHLMNTEDIGKYYLWDDDLFLYYFCIGLLDKEEGKYRLAQFHLDKARFHMSRTNGSKFLFYPIFAIEQANLYRMQQEDKKAEKVLSECIRFCLEFGYKKNIDLLTRHLEQKEEIEHNFTEMGISVDYEELIELSRRAAIIQELNKKNKDMDFLYTWQDVVSQQNDKGILINVAINILQSNFNVDQVIYLTKEDSQFKIKYATKNTAIEDHQIEVIKDKLEFETNGFAVSRIERKFENYKDIISFFGIDSIWSILCVPIVVDDVVKSILIAYNEVHSNLLANQNILTEDDIVIVKYAFRQLNDAIEKVNAKERIIQINNELKKSSITDVLTGALNRNGFIEKINKLNETLLNSNITKKSALTVLYIDLDNFKYYNDTFGHDVGDLILIEFAGIFNRVIGKKGYCVRYGGDEFVLVLNNSKEKDGEIVANNIFHEIIKANYFIDKVEAKLNYKIAINNDSKVSCSVGIADTMLFDKLDINDILKRADEALYSVKKSTKRGYKLWSTMSY